MGGKTSTTTQPTFQTQTSSPNPQAAQAYQTALDRAGASANIPFQTYSMDPNAFVAPLNSTQTNAIDYISGQQGSANPAFNAAYGYTAQGANPTYNTVGNYMSPYLNDVAAPTLAYLRQQQGQDLAKQQSDAIMKGSYGGDRAGISRAVLQGQQGLAQAKTYGDILNQGYNTALGAAQQGAQTQLAAGNQFGSLGAAQQNAALQQGQAQLGAGTAAQQTEQAGKQALYNQFLQYVAYPFQTTQFLANVAGGLGPLMGSTSTGFGMQQSTQPAPFFSDRRLKENVKKVGELHDGQPVYKYDYGDGRTQIGLMAQDVEDDHPEAVGLHPSGFKMVDYDAATKDAERPAKFYGGGLGGGIDSILQQQAQFLPGAAKQGAQSYVPQSGGLRPGQMNAPQLNLSASKPQQQQSGLSKATGDMKELAGLGSGLKNAYQGAKDLYGKYGPDAGAGAPASTDLDASDFSKAPEPPRWDDAIGDAVSDFASGGLVPRDHFAEGGIPGDNSAGPDYFPDEVLKEGAKNDMATALKAPQLNLTPSGGGGGGGQGGGGLGDIGKLAGGAGSFMSSAAEFLPLLLANRGGRVNKDGGGPISDDLPDDAGDYSAVLPDSEIPKFKGLGPDFTPRLMKFMQDNPHPIGLTSGFRTSDEQADLYARKPGLAAPPGHSNHEKGLAGDLNYYGNNEARDWAHANADKYGLRFPMLGANGGKNEPWHVEPADKPTRLAYAGSPNTASDALPPGAGFSGSASPANSSDDTGLGAALSGAGDWFSKNQNWLVPVLSGLGSMASSPSRYLGSAILQGLGGGAQAYQQQQQLQNRNALTNAQVKNIGSEIDTRKGHLGVEQAKVDLQLQMLRRQMDAATEAARIGNGGAPTSPGGLAPPQTPMISPSSVPPPVATTTPAPTGLPAAKSPNAPSTPVVPEGQPPVAAKPAPAQMSTPDVPEQTAKAATPVSSQDEEFLKNVAPQNNPRLILQQADTYREQAETYRKQAAAYRSRGLPTDAQNLEQKSDMQLQRANDLATRAKTLMSGPLLMKDGSSQMMPSEKQRVLDMKLAEGQATERAKRETQMFELNKKPYEDAAAAKDLAIQTKANSLAMKNLVFDENGKPVVSTGPQGDFRAKLAANLEQIGLPKSIVDRVASTDPSKAEAVKKLGTDMVGEVARQSLGPGNRLYATEYKNYMQGVPNLEILPRTIQFLVDKIIVPKSDWTIKRFAHVADSDLHDKNLQSDLWKYDQANPLENLLAPQTKAMPKPPSELGSLQGGLQYNAKTGQWRNKATGKVYDANGSEIQ